VTYQTRLFDEPDIAATHTLGDPVDPLGDAAAWGAMGFAGVATAAMGDGSSATTPTAPRFLRRPLVAAPAAVTAAVLGGTGDVMGAAAAMGVAAGRSGHANATGARNSCSSSRAPHLLQISLSASLPLNS
jgi:hypothetical protein